MNITTFNKNKIARVNKLSEINTDEVEPSLLRDIKGSAEVVLGLLSTTQGGQLNRTLAVTRFLRAAGPVQARIGWRVEPSMGFIVDITAVS